MHAASWMDLEDILLGEINQIQENKRGFTCKKYLEYTNSLRQKVDGDNQEKEGWEGERLLFIGSRVCFRDYECCFSCCYDKIPT